MGKLPKDTKLGVTLIIISSASLPIINPSISDLFTHLCVQSYPTLSHQYLCLGYCDGLLAGLWSMSLPCSKHSILGSSLSWSSRNPKYNDSSKGRELVVGCMRSWRALQFRFLAAHHTTGCCPHVPKPSWFCSHIHVPVTRMGKRERDMPNHLRAMPRSCAYHFCLHLIDKNLITWPHIYAKTAEKYTFK